MKCIPTGDHVRVNGWLFIAIVFHLMLVLAACGTNAAEKAIEGTWVSKDSDMVFAFFEDGTYHIANPNGLFKKELTGRYHSRGTGSSSILSEAEFVLVDGLDIKFNSTGDAFFINVDGTRGGDLFYRVLNE